MIRWLVILLVLGGCEDSSRKPRHRIGTGAHLVYRPDVGALDGPAQRAALDQALATLRARVDALDVPGATVQASAGEIVVDLPGVDQATYERARAELPRSAKLELCRVLEDTVVMRDLYAELRNTPSSRVRVDDDVWSTPDGRTELEPYVHGDRADLEALHPIGLPPEEKIVVEHLDGTEWRTYDIEQPARLTGADVADAQVMWNPQTNRPEVLVTFDAHGRDAFAALTHEAVGHKLAILVDGVVVSAPVVNAQISGGKTTITMGGNDAAQQQQDADELVRNLRLGSLPVLLVEEFATRISDENETRTP